MQTLCIQSFILCCTYILLVINYYYYIKYIYIGVVRRAAYPKLYLTHVTSIKYIWCRRTLTTIRYILPSIGPAKSTCSRAHGHVGHFRGCSAEDGEALISWSMPGHHIRLHARDFILDTPGCPPCKF